MVLKLGLKMSEDIISLPAVAHVLRNPLPVISSHDRVLLQVHHDEGSLGNIMVATSGMTLLGAYITCFNPLALMILMSP
jgi:hypothetical protein